MSDYEARARNTDPSTSHEAASRANKSTKGAKIQQAAIDLAVKRPLLGVTAGEVTIETGYDWADVSRNMSKTKPELCSRNSLKKDDGLVLVDIPAVRESPNGDGAFVPQQIWYAKEFLPDDCVLPK